MHSQFYFRTAQGYIILLILIRGSVYGTDCIAGGEQTVPGLQTATRSDGRNPGAFTRERIPVDALNNVSFNINEGELVGYIGPNGAGKSTTVKIMSGILIPDSGHCQIMGRVPWQERTAHVAQIGVVFGQRSQLWWDLPVQDSFDLIRDIYGINARDYSKRLTNLTDILDIANLLGIPVRQLSLGQRIRCELIASLLHNPRILFLDEPTIGLDAVSKLALRSFLKELNEKHGVTMILTTHDMTDIDSLCRRVMVIGRGHLPFDGSLQHLKQRYSPQRRIRAKLSRPVTVTHLAGAERVEMSNGEYLVYFRPDHTPTQEMIATLAASCPLADMMVEEQDVDQMIADMYKELRLCQ